MKLSPQQAPLYGECVLTVQLCDDERVEEEEEVEFYLLFAGSTQRHLASTLRLSQLTLQAICPAHNSIEVVQVTLCSARPGGSVDTLAEECFQFVQDLAWDMAQFLVSHHAGIGPSGAGDEVGGGGDGGGSSSSSGGQEGALLLDECQIPLQECEKMDSNLALALRHLTLPQGWSVLDTKMSAQAQDTQKEASRCIDDPPRSSTGRVDSGQQQQQQQQQPDTLLHFAARRGLRQVALFLLEQPGGREALRHPNQHGRTPAREAQKHGHARLQELLSNQQEEQFSPESTALEKLKKKKEEEEEERNVFPGGRGCLRHHPQLRTYSLTQHVAPGGNPPPTLQREVQDFQKLIRCHRDHREGGVAELQQQLARLYPATGSEDDRPGKGRPNGSSSSSSSSRRAAKRKRGRRNNNNNNSPSSSSSSHNSNRTTSTKTHHHAETQGTTDTPPTELSQRPTDGQVAEPPLNHVGGSARDGDLCPNGERPGDKAGGEAERAGAGPTGEPPPPPPQPPSPSPAPLLAVEEEEEEKEEWRGSLVDSSEAARNVLRLEAASVATVQRIEEAEAEDHTSLDTATLALASGRESPSPSAAEQEEKRKGEETSSTTVTSTDSTTTTTTTTMGHTQSQEQQQQQQQQHKATREMREVKGGRGNNKGTSVPLGHVGQPQMTDSLLQRQETEPDSGSDGTTTQSSPPPVPAVALNNGHREDSSTCGEEASGAAKDDGFISQHSLADGEPSKEKETAKKGRIETTSDLDQPSEELLQKGDEQADKPNDGVAIGGLEVNNMAGGRSNGEEEELTGQMTENSTESHAACSPTEQQEKSNPTSSVCEGSLVTDSLPQTDFSSSIRTHTHTIYSEVETDDRREREETDSTLKRTCSSSTEQEEVLDFMVSLRPGMAPGPTHLPEPDGTSMVIASAAAAAAAASSDAFVSEQDCAENTCSPEACDRVVADDVGDRETAGPAAHTETAATNQTADSEQQANQSSEREDEKDDGTAPPVPLSGVALQQELSYAAVLKRTLASEQEEQAAAAPAEEEESREEREEEGEQEENGEPEKPTLPLESPLQPPAEAGAAPAQTERRGSCLEQDVSTTTGSEPFAHTEEDRQAATDTGAESFNDSEPCTSTDAGSVTTKGEPDNVVDTESSSHVTTETAKQRIGEVDNLSERGLSPGEYGAQEQQTAEFIPGGSSPDIGATQTEGTVPGTHTEPTEAMFPETFTVWCEGMVSEAHTTAVERTVADTHSALSVGMVSETDMLHSQQFDRDKGTTSLSEASCIKGGDFNSQSDSLAHPMQTAGISEARPQHTEGGTVALEAKTDLSLTFTVDANSSSKALSAPLEEQPETGSSRAESQAELQRSPVEEIVREGCRSDCNVDDHRSERTPQESETKDFCPDGHSSSPEYVVCADVSPQLSQDERCRSTEGSGKECQQVALEATPMVVDSCEGDRSPDLKAKEAEDSEGDIMGIEGTLESERDMVGSERNTHVLVGNVHFQSPAETSTGRPVLAVCLDESPFPGDVCLISSYSAVSDRQVEDTHSNTNIHKTDTYTESNQSETDTCLHTAQSLTDTRTSTAEKETTPVTHASQSETETDTGLSEAQSEVHSPHSTEETDTHTHSSIEQTESPAHRAESDTDSHTHLMLNDTEATNAHTVQSEQQPLEQLSPNGCDPALDTTLQGRVDSPPRASMSPDEVFLPGPEPSLPLGEVCLSASSREVGKESEKLEPLSTAEEDAVDGRSVIVSNGSEEAASALEPITDEIHRQTEVFYAVDSCAESDLQKNSKECSDVPVCSASENVAAGSDEQPHTLADGITDLVTEPKAESLAPAVITGTELPSPSPPSSSTDDPPSSPHLPQHPHPHPPPPSAPSDATVTRSSWSSADSWQASPVPAAVPAEAEEAERKDRVTEVPALSALLRPAMRPLSPFRRHSWGPGKAPQNAAGAAAAAVTASGTTPASGTMSAAEGEPSTKNFTRSLAIRSPGAPKSTKPTGHRRSVSWCPSDIFRPPPAEQITNRSSSLEGLSAEQEAGGSPASVSQPEPVRVREPVRADRGSSLVSLTEEEQESDMGECSSLDSQKSIGLLRSLGRPPHPSLTKSRSLVAISPKDLDAVGRVRPKRRISFSFSISPLLPKSKTFFSIGSSSSDEEEAVSLASFSSASGSLDYSISEEDPGPLRTDGEGRQGTKVSRTFSYLKSKMSKKGKEKDKEKDRLREKDAKEKEKGLCNGHLFSAITNAPSTPCQHCSRPLNTKEAFICNNCSAHVHKGCRESLPVCAKVKMKPPSTVPDSASLTSVSMRNKTTVVGISRDRPKSTISFPDDQPPLNPPRKSTSGIMSFSGHSPLSKSVSITNIAGPMHDDMPLKKFLSQSTDNLHKTSKVNESTESLTDEGTEMMDTQLLCEFEADVRDLESDSWSVTVDKKQLKQLKKEVVKRQDVIYELMQTELHQVRTLRIMGEVYCKGLLRELQLEGAALERLFPCLDELTELHTLLLSALLERRRQTPLTRDPNAERGYLVHRVGDVLVHQFSGSNAERMKKVYGKFCSRHNEAVNYYKELHAKDKRFQAFIKKKMSSAIVRRLSIPECILLVTQRITKYPVLIQRILQHTKDGDEEQEEVSRALRLVKEVISAVDTRVHEYERRRRLKDVYGRTDSKSIMRMKSGQMFAREDLLRGRRLIHDGPLQLKTSVGRFKEVQALLLSDVFVFMQEKDQKYIFASLDQRSTVISLQKLIVREVANEEKALFLITAGIERPEMVEVYASSKDERNTWMQLIQNAMQSIEKDEDEGIPSEGEEDKRLQESKAKEMRDLLHRKDEQILGLLEDKVKLFRELCDCAAPDDLMHTLRGRMMFRATPSDVTKGEPIMKDAIKEVETLQELVNRSVGGAVGHQMSSCQDAPGGSVGPVCLPRRAETFGGFDSHQMNISKNGEKDEGEDLRRTESDSVLKKGGNANLLLLLKRNSEVLSSVTHLHDLLLALQGVVIQQDSFIEDQRQALTGQRSASFSSTSSLCSSASASTSSSRPTSGLTPSISSLSSMSTFPSTSSTPSTTPTSGTTPTPTPIPISNVGPSTGAAETGVSSSAQLAEQERALAEERRRWQGLCEERERGLAERELQTRQQEEERDAGARQLEQERRQLQERQEELQRDLRLLQEREEEVRREREKLREAQARVEQEREQMRLQHHMQQQQQRMQEEVCRPHRTPSTTSDDSMKFQSSGSLERFPTADADLSLYSTSAPTSTTAKDLLSRMDSKKRKGKSLNPFASSSSSLASGASATQSRGLLQLTKAKDKKDKKKKKGKGQPASPTDNPGTEATDAPADGEVFFC
ncbi:A-kinase anchor protein 13 isoform X2 [Engraulis encrasicolus]|uniref:A-kinase anchor protein 13 isoform X2 n=1 Tax=Engraulis encrasicolus TaxID=184585 RepID=UPI002FD583E4